MIIIDDNQLLNNSDFRICNSITIIFAIISIIYG